MTESGHARSRIIMLSCVAVVPFVALLAWSSPLEVSKSAADRWESVARLFKYLGMLLTAILTGCSVLTDTVHRVKGPPPKIILTQTGVFFVIFLYISTLVTAVSAVVQDKADDRVRYWERRQGNKEVREEFDAEMMKLRPDLEKQRQALEEQSRSLAKQKSSIDSATKSIKNSGELVTTMVVRTGRELEFTNHQFKDLSLILSIDDARIAMPPAEENYTNLGKQLRSYRDAKCNVTDLRNPRNEKECDSAQDAFNQWDASNELTNYLDPTRHLQLDIQIEFAGFTVEGLSSHCEMPTKKLSDSVECLDFTLDSKGAEGERVNLTFTSVTVPILLGGNILFTFANKAGFEQAFSEDGINGRDASFQGLVVEACDEDNSVSRATQLRSNVKFVVTVAGIDKSTSREVSQSYQLREFRRGAGTAAECVSTYYTDAPASLVPRIK